MSSSSVNVDNSTGVLTHSWVNGSVSIPDDSFYYPGDSDQAVLPSGDYVRRLERPERGHAKYWSINGVISEPSEFDPPEVSWEDHTGKFPRFKEFTYCSFESYADWLIQYGPKAWNVRRETKEDVLGRLKTQTEQFANPHGLQPYEEWAREKAQKEYSEGIICQKCLKTYKKFFVRYQVGSRSSLLCPCGGGYPAAGN